MMTVQCPSCSKLYNIPETMAGKQVRCKQCGMVFAIATQEQASQVPPTAGAPLDGALDQQPQMSPGGPAGQAAGAGSAMRAAASGGNKTLMLIGGGAVGVAALAAVAIFVIYPMFFGGQPGWTKPLMPEGTKMVGYMDVASFRESDLFVKLKEMVEETSGGAVNNPDEALEMLASMLDLKTKLKTDDISSVFIAAGDVEAMPPKVVAGIRLNRSMSLDDLLSGPAVKKSKYKDKQYLTAHFEGVPFAVCIGQIDDETFCVALSEAELKKTLDRVESGDSVKLSDELDSILGKVSGNAFFVAVDASAIPGASSRRSAPKYFGAGLDINGSIDGFAIAVFKNSKTAEDQAKEAQDGLEKAKKNMADEIEDSERRLGKMSGSRKESKESELRVMKTVAGWLDNVDIDQSGDTIKFSASIDTAELLDIFDDVKKMMRGMGIVPRRSRMPASMPYRRR